MKNLFYKELKLSIHPLCYIFSVAFGLLGLVPNYPSTIAFLYTIASYTLLFLGANKSVTTNDLFYTLNLPIRKRDVVKARLISISFLHFITGAILPIALLIRAKFITPNIVVNPEEAMYCLDIQQAFAFYGIVLFIFSIVDLIYIPWFYKTGKSIIGPTLVGALVGAILLLGLPIGLATNETILNMLTIGHADANYFIQIGILVFGIACYVGSRFIINKISADRLEKLDF